MADNTIKEFLVALGFQVDNTSLSKWSKQIEGASKQVAEFAVAIEAAAAAIGIAVAKMANDFEALYYSSRRIGDSAENVKAFDYAVSQLGGTAEGARGSLEAVGKFIQSFPSANKFIEGIGHLAGVNIPLGKTEETIEGVAKAFQKWNAEGKKWLALKFGESLGLDYRTINAMIDGVGEFSEEFHEAVRRSGVDLTEATERGQKFSQQLRSIGLVASLVWDKVSLALIKKLQPALVKFRLWLLDNFDDIVQKVEKLIHGIETLATFFVLMGERIYGWLKKLDDATGGWSTRIIELTAAIWLLNKSFLASPIGIVIALGLAIAGLVDDYIVWKEGGKSLIDWSKWEPDIEAAITGIKKLRDEFVAISSFLKNDLGISVGGIAKSAFDFLGASIHVVIDGLLFMLDILTGNWKGAWSAAADAITSVWGPVEHMLISAYNTIQRINNIARRKIGLAEQPLIGEGVSPSAGSVSDVAKLMAMGWTKAQAEGLAANIQRESKGDPNAVGDNGHAYGLSQWHADRQANFAKWAGHDIRQSTRDEQLAFMNYELRQGTERAAGTALSKALDAASAGATVSSQYERPADAIGEMLKRADIATMLSKSSFAVPSATLGPSAGSFGGRGGASLNQATTINVYGARDPAATADAVEDRQSRVHSNLIRNFNVALA